MIKKQKPSRFNKEELLANIKISQEKSRMKILQRNREERIKAGRDPSGKATRDDYK